MQPGGQVLFSLLILPSDDLDEDKDDVMIMMMVMMIMTVLNITIANIYDNRNKVGRGEGRLAKCYSSCRRLW